MREVQIDDTGAKESVALCYWGVFLVLRLWYNHPAQDWNEALPLGNGRLGAMVYAQPVEETVVLNEESVWSGGFRDRINGCAVRNIEKIRLHLREGELDAAQKLAQLALCGNPEGERVYRTAGELHISFEGLGEISDYRRELDLETAVSTVLFSSGGKSYRRTCFVSAPDDVAVMHLFCSDTRSISFTLSLDRGTFFDTVGALSDTCVYMESRSEIPFAVAVRAIASGGECSTYGGKLRVKDADEVLLLIDCRTGFREEDYLARCNACLEEAAQKTFYVLHHSHIDDYQQYFDRLSMKIGDDELSEVPTDVRLSGYARGYEDDGLVVLYYQYARYLLISSSREGTLPANLQGIWNKDIDPAWGSKFTLNINAEMNYWAADMCALSELEMPLFEHLKRMHPHGIEAARKMYGVRGFVAHHNTDIWGDCAPQDNYIPGSYWPLGGAWLCTMLWDHYEYTQDTDFLAEYYPILCDACLFFCDFLKENEKGQLIVTPSVSPENSYIKENTTASLCEGCAMDGQILRDLFSACIKTEEVLGVEDGLSERLCELINRLPPIEIGESGGIMEWLEDFQEAETGHRHLSHLYALYPSGLITPDATPELAEAARISLERRETGCSGATGWSRAWMLNLWARLRDGEKALFSLKKLLANSTQPNLLDSHPPFQIDGNFGALAGITQMLIQSIGSDIVLLPALPASWRNGYISGVRLRGGMMARLVWKDGEASELIIFCERQSTVTLVSGSERRELTLMQGENKVI